MNEKRIIAIDPGTSSGVEGVLSDRKRQRCQNIEQSSTWFPRCCVVLRHHEDENVGKQIRDFFPAEIHQPILRGERRRGRKIRCCVGLAFLLAAVFKQTEALSLTIAKCATRPVFSVRKFHHVNVPLRPPNWLEEAFSSAAHCQQAARGALVMSVQSPHMFLSPASVSLLKIPSSANQGEAVSREKTATSTTTSVDSNPTISVHKKSRGVLGFQVDSNMMTNDHPRNGATESSSALHASRVDSSAWNGPVQWDMEREGDDSSVFKSWQTSARRIWTTGTSSNSGTMRTSQAPLDQTILSRETIDSSTVKELKQMLADRGLPVSGNKATLQDRLLDWRAAQLLNRRRADPNALSSLNLREAYHVSRRQAGLETTDEDDVLSERIEQSMAEDPPKLKADSLAEWARTLDIEPLLQRREAIHREKLQGKPVEKAKSVPRPTESPEYRQLLARVFDKPSSPYSNREVKQMYLAAKHADQTGDRDLARKLLCTLKDATPNDARIYRRLARMEQEEGDYAAARAYLLEGLRIQPQNAYLWQGLGQLAGTDSERKRCYRKAIEADPKMPNAYHALGTLEHTQGRIAVARQVLNKGLEYCPTNHRLHHALGDLYRDAKMLDLAEKSYRKALLHGPSVSHGFALTALACVAYEQGNVDECRSYLRKAISLNNGRQASAWVALSQMEEAEGNVIAAREACILGLSQYERGLIERNLKIKFPYKPLKLEGSNDPLTIKNAFMKTVPEYRSGDKFYNLYRNWVRIEERYGSVESVEEVYQRAKIAFPREWKLTLDWAKFYEKLNIHDHARKLYAQACSEASGRHADPFRLYAELEMSHGKYREARKILYSGAVSLSLMSDGNRCGYSELFHTWAVCEWHLGELSRAEILFDNALRMTNAGEEGSKLRSYILYSIALLEFSRGEHLLAQHCIGLCLKENVMPGGNSKIWQLWALVASKLGNESLERECLQQVANAQSMEHEDGPAVLSRLMNTTGGLSRMKGLPDMEILMRRDPWHQKIFGSQDKNSFFKGPKFPVSLTESSCMYEP